MDLLGGYGSDDSEESSRNSDSPRQNNASSLLSPKQTPAAQPKKQSRRAKFVGKRIVSLHAVLPQAIRDGLARNSYEDDSSEDDKGGTSNQITATSTYSKKPASQDAGLSNLLSELQSASTSNAKVEPMGLSLAVSTVETTSTGTTTATGKQEPKQKPTAMDATASLSRTTGLSMPRVSAPRVREAAPRINQSQRTMAASTAPKQYPPQLPKEEPIHGAAPKPFNKKRQELEKALRSGQFHAVENVVELTASDFSANATTMPPQQQQQHESMGFKKSSLPVTGKHRSKHQINQLMASAIHLDQQRSREAGLNNTRTSSNSTRANAKRKYGW